MYRLHCPDCARNGAAGEDDRELQNLADAHNDMHHRGQPLATVRRARFRIPLRLPLLLTRR
jgi:hypothetical protein